MAHEERVVVEELTAGQLIVGQVKVLLNIVVVGEKER